MLSKRAQPRQGARKPVHGHDTYMKNNDGFGGGSFGLLRATDWFDSRDVVKLFLLYLKGGRKEFFIFT